MSFTITKWPWAAAAQSCGNFAGAFVMINMVMLQWISVISPPMNNNVLCLHNASVLDHCKKIILKNMAYASVETKESGCFDLETECMKSCQK